MAACTRVETAARSHRSGPAQLPTLHRFLGSRPERLQISVGSLHLPTQQSRLSDAAGERRAWEANIANTQLKQ